MRNYKIYPEYSLVVVVHDSNTELPLNYFHKFSTEIKSNENYEPYFNLLIDGRLFHWSAVNPKDVSRLIDKSQACHDIKVACLVSNIGQVAYEQLIFNNIPIDNVKYFTSPTKACEFLSVPEEVLDM